MDRFSGIQARLSEAQSKCIVGPLFVSPVKAVVSVAEVAGGLAMAAIAGVAGGVCCGNETLLNISSKGFGLVGEGLVGIISSVFNVATLGVSSCCTQRILPNVGGVLIANSLLNQIEQGVRR